MNPLFLILAFICCPLAVPAQWHADSIYQYRQHYKEEFLTDEHSPLSAKDTSFLRFYAPDEHYVVTASLKLTPEDPEFDLLTHSGQKKVYRRYAIASFTLKGKKHSLNLYQSMTLIKKEAYRQSLFLPFNDLTNYESTYGGGRYLDLSINDIKNNTIIIDFNKAYNPYCAFAGGYSCPIPPDGNKLSIKIEAGEQQYAGTVKE